MKEGTDSSRKSDTTDDEDSPLPSAWRGRGDGQICSGTARRGSHSRRIIVCTILNLNLLAQATGLPMTEFPQPSVATRSPPPPLPLPPPLPPVEDQQEPKRQRLTPEPYEDDWTQQTEPCAAIQIHLKTIIEEVCHWRLPALSKIVLPL